MVDDHGAGGTPEGVDQAAQAVEGAGVEADEQVGVVRHLGRRDEPVQPGQEAVVAGDHERLREAHHRLAAGVGQGAVQGQADPRASPSGWMWQEITATSASAIASTAACQSCSGMLTRLTSWSDRSGAPSSASNRSIRAPWPGTVSGTNSSVGVTEPQLRGHEGPGPGPDSASRPRRRPVPARRRAR